MSNSNQEVNSTHFKPNGWLVLIVLPLFLLVAQNHYDGSRATRQFESNLILNAIEKNDIEASKDNIRFLIESGLISKKNEKIVHLLNDTSFFLNLKTKDTVQIKPQNKYLLRPKEYDLRSGRIINQFEMPIVGAEVYMNATYNVKTKKWVNWYAKTETDHNGLFEIPIPETSSYKFTIYKEGYELINLIMPNSPYMKHSNTIKLKRLD